MILNINSDCSFDTYMKRVFNYLNIDIPKQTIDDIIESINVNYIINQKCLGNDYMLEEINFLRHLILLKEENK